MKLLLMCLLTSMLFIIWPCYCHNLTRFVCYFLNSGRYRTESKGIGQFTVDNIDPTLCTHLIYAFASLNGQNYEIEIKDTLADIYHRGYEKFVALKTKNPKLKVMISIGGSSDTTDGSEKYTKLVANSSYRNTFVSSALAFLQRYKFDGMDFDLRPSSADEAAGFTHLVVALKGAFRPYRFLLSSTCSQFENAADFVKPGDISLLNENVDFFNLWTMGFYGDKTEPDSADHPAPLLKRSWDIYNWYVDFAVSYWMKKGIPADKIVVGIPLYGTGWTLASNNIVPPALAKGSSPPGNITRTSGMMTYYEICHAIRTAGWKSFPDPSGAMGPYAVSPTSPKIWVGYDDPKMAIVKSQYILAKGLGGAFVWTVDMDDFRNICRGGVNPILTAISKSLSVFIPTTETTTKTYIRATQNNHNEHTFVNISSIIVQEARPVRASSTATNRQPRTYNETENVDYICGCVCE